MRILFIIYFFIDKDSSVCS